MLTNVAITDPQGQSFTNAVVRVREANRESSVNSTTTESLVTDSSDYSKDAVVNTDNRSYENDYLRCVFVYWPTQASYDGGYNPYVLINKDANGDQSFQVNKEELSKSKYEGLAVEEVCEKFFTDVVLPTLA